MAVGGAKGAEETPISKNGCRLRPRFSLPFYVDYQSPLFLSNLLLTGVPTGIRRYQSFTRRPLAHFLADSPEIDTIEKFLFAPQDKHNMGTLPFGSSGVTGGAFERVFVDEPMRGSGPQGRLTPLTFAARRSPGWASERRRLRGDGLGEHLDRVSAAGGVAAVAEGKTGTDGDVSRLRFPAIL